MWYRLPLYMLRRGPLSFCVRETFFRCDSPCLYTASAYACPSLGSRGSVLPLHVYLHSVGEDVLSLAVIVRMSMQAFTPMSLLRPLT